MSNIFDKLAASNGGNVFDRLASSPKKGIIDRVISGGEDVLGSIVGAGEIAANLATQTYGLPARGYGEIANLVTGRTDLGEKVGKALIYEPQTESGRAGMDAIGSAFDWWHNKSMAVGTHVQEAVAKRFGETAGNVAGATVASTMEAAPLLLGGAYAKGKAKFAKRRAAADRAEMASKIERDTRIQKEAGLSRAYLGEVIPDDPIKAAAAREAATRQVGEDIFDRINRGYLGEEVQPKGIREDLSSDPFVMGRKVSPEEITEKYGAEVYDRIRRGYTGEEVQPKGIREDLSADPYVMERTPTPAEQLEKYGSDVYDRIRRGYLGDTTAEAPPKPIVFPQVQEYAGPRPPAPKQLAPPAVEPPPAAPVTEAPTAGPKIGDEIRFIRYGKQVKNSTDWSKNETLPGMSVYSLNKDGSAQQTIRSEFADKADVYIGTGKVVGFGSDGEPLVSNYTASKATKLAEEKAYYSGKSRAEWLRERGLDDKGNKTIPEPLANIPKPMEEEPGQIARNVLGNERGSSPEVANAAKQIKEFFVPLSTMPQGKAYMSLRYKDLLGGLTRVDRVVGRLSDRFKGLSATDKTDVFNAISGEIPMVSLPAETQTIAKQTHADIERVGALLVRRGLLKKEVFEANKDTYIHYMYLRHILPDDASIPIGKGGRLDLSYLKARKDLTPEMRKELGLIEDVSVAAPAGMGKALGDVVKADFFRKVAANPDWVWQPSKEIARLASEFKAYKQIVERGENVGSEVTAKYNQLKADLDARSAEAGKAPADFVQLPDSPAYGELKGAFVRKEIANDIVPVYSVNVGELEGLARIWNKAGRGFDMGMTLFKVGKIALNPPTMARNTISNVIQMNMSGIPVYRLPVTIVSGVQSILSKDNMYRTFERNGGFKTNFSVAELGEVLKTFQKAKGGAVDKFFMAVTEAAKYYGKIDDIAKMSLFKDAVTKQGMSVPDAVLYAHKWGMDYSLASRSVKHGRRYVLPFLSYQYKIAPLIAESLVKRPWVIAKYAAIPYIMSKAIAAKYGWTEKDLDKSLKMMAEKTKGQGAYMLLPTKNNKGDIEIVNMEYFLPWGNLMEAARDIKGGDFIDTAKQFGGILGPYGNVISMLNTKRQGEPPKDPFSGQPVYSKLDSPQTKYIKQVEWWWKLFGPSSVSSYGALGYTAKAITGDKDKWGVEATGAKALLKWVGMNVGSLDDQSIIATRKFKIRQLEAELQKVFRDPKYSKEERQNAIKRMKIERQKILNPR